MAINSTRRLKIDGMMNQKGISDVLWASANDWDREWIQQVIALLVGHGAFTLYPGCPIHQWLNSIDAQVIVEKWQSPEQLPNLYWLPLPEVDGHALACTPNSKTAPFTCPVRQSKWANHVWVCY